MRRKVFSPFQIFGVCECLAVTVLPCIKRSIKREHIPKKLPGRLRKSEALKSSPNCARLLVRYGYRTYDYEFNVGGAGILRGRRPT